MYRVAIAGFLHETNTFAPSKAPYEAFVHGGGHPPMTRGSAIVATIRNMNWATAGFLDVAEAQAWQVVPIVWCAASPSAQVETEAYERISKMIVEGIKAAGQLDGVYLDLHGAMVAEHLDDGEGEILARVRGVIGEKVPLVASLDLHANVTPQMIEHADALIAYRTYPHVDMAETGRAAALHLDLLLRSKQRFAKAFRQLPFLIPISWQCTDIEPSRSIYAELRSLQNANVPTLSFAPGFPAADFPDCGPTVFAYAATQSDADAAADEMAALICSHESDFDGRIYTPDEGVRYAMARASRSEKPVVIADTQDNPGAGGDSDTTGMLRALVRNGATKAAVGVICDPQAAAAAHAAGKGASITLGLGGKSRIPGDAPFEATFAVDELSDGRFIACGPYSRGTKMDLGASACLRIEDIRIVVATHKAQLADQAMYRYVGIEPTEQSILVNKSSVHFRADFAPIAEEIIICAAPGPMPADTAQLPWTRLRSGMRLRPSGPTFKRRA